MIKYVVYHRQGGYYKEDNSFTDDPKEAQLFDTKEKAEIEIGSYQDCTKEIQY